MWQTLVAVEYSDDTRVNIKRKVLLFNSAEDTYIERSRY
jgi:hypothetical protein